MYFVKIDQEILFLFWKRFRYLKGSSINEVKDLGGGSMILWGQYERLFTKKHDYGWRGVKNWQKLSDPIYGQPLTHFYIKIYENQIIKYFWPESKD